jgi:serine/threonine protein kinase
MNVYFLLLVLSVWAQPGRQAALKRPAADIYELFDENFIGKGNFKDHFAVVKQIGQGGRSSVWLIRSRSNADEYVCKRVLTGNMQKIMKEVRVGRLFSHPNIVKMYGLYQLGSENCIITEYLGERWVDGYDFLDQRKRLAESDAKIIFRQVVNAVDYMHQEGYAHNDLKTENTMIHQDTFQAKVIDLGSATLYTLTLIAFDGTEIFAPPEAFSGQFGMLEQREIWAMGCILYALLYSMHPFEDGLEITSKELSFPKIKWTSRKWVSGDAKALISDMLTKDPLHRATLDDVKTSPFLNRRSLFGF